VKLVKVDRDALEKLVERARRHAQSMADEWGMGAPDDPDIVEMENLIKALGVEGL
jgi:hypothetical protein